MQSFLKQPSPDPGAANSLFTFLASRLSSTLSADGINCVSLLKIQNPITLTTDADGVATAATINTTTTAPTPTTPATNVVTGSATAKLYPQSHSVVLLMKLNYPNQARKQVAINVTPDSCTGKPIFTQKQTTDRQGNINAFALIRNVQGAALPTNWFLTITDPALTGNQIVGCGAIAAKGVTGTVTLSATPATPAATPTTNAAVTPTVVATPTMAAATPTVAVTPTIQVTATPAPAATPTP